jgi:uncharacterized RDD family membrane protein YckC
MTQSIEQLAYRDGQTQINATDKPRAGYWRRTLASLIDALIISAPFQLLAAILFVVTAGWIQDSSGITWTSCDSVKEIPQALAPAPPVDANIIRDCRVFFFGMETARTLFVARATKQGSTTTSVFTTYMLDRDGHSIQGVSIDLLVFAVFAAYVAAMESRRGATICDRFVGIRVIAAAAPSARGAPIMRIVARYLAMFLGLAPMLAVLLFYFVRDNGNVEAIAESGFFRWIGVAGFIGVIWFIVLVIQIAAKRDPYYDRIAGTAVLRISG